jgi:hypothetical protein
MLSYGGVWTTALASGYSGGSIRFARGSGSGYTFKFSGTGADILALKGPTYGIANVILDGTTQTVSFYSPTYKNAQPVWSKRNLAEGVHVVRVEWTGSKDASATGDNICIDAIDVLGGLQQAPAFDIITRFQETDPMISFGGVWSTASNNSYSGGTLKSGRGGGLGYTVQFSGTGMDLIGLKGPDYGIANVILDGTTETVSFYAPAYQNVQKVWSKRNLSAGSHTVRVEWTGTKDPSSTGDKIDLDAVDVLGGLTQAPMFTNITRFQEDNALLSYSGAWKTATSSGYSGGALRYSNDSSASCSFSFSGSGIALLALKGPNYGKAIVTLDGTTTSTVDLYSSSFSNAQQVFNLQDLTPGTHTILISWTGTMNQSSTGSVIDVDAIDVTEGALVAP